MAAHQYRPVATQDLESMRSESSGAELPPQRPGKPIPPWILLGMILLLSNSLSILSGYYWASSGSSMTEQTTSPSPGPAAQRYPLDTTWKQFWWNTPYSVNSNRTEEDGLWEAIQPAHGFVAVDRTWAQDHDWPESMYLPSDTSKGVYLLEAYHYLHCLRIIRKTFLEAIEGTPSTDPPGAHMKHCFDALRQYVICNADSTPLYTFGDFTAGNGQVHECKDWAQLRDYATRNTACYRDSDDRIPLGEHFGYCDDGNDGVLELP